MRRVVALLTFALACTPVPTPVTPPDAGTPPVTGLPDGEVRATLVVSDSPTAGARFELFGSPVVTASGADGAVVLHGVPPGRWVFRANGTNGETAMLRTTLAPASNGLAQGTDLGRIVLGPVGSLHGKVLKSGAGVIGARVVIVGSAGTLSLDGSYAFHGLAPGTYELRAAIDDASGTRVSAAIPATVTGGQDTALDLNILETFSSGSLHGTLVAKGPSLSLAGASGQLPMRVPGDDGTYEEADLPAGIYGLLATSGGRTAGLPFVAIGGSTELDSLWIPNTEGCTAPAPDADLDGTPDDAEPAACRCDPRGTRDADHDGLCDDLDPDADGDGADDLLGNCHALPAGDPRDRDGDHVGDACDVCPDVADPDQADSDHDGIGDACDTPPAWGLCASSGWCWEHPLPAGESYAGLSGTSDADLWLVAGAGGMHHWDGSHTTLTPTPIEAAGLTVTDVFARTPTDAWAIGTGGAIAHWDGTEWRSVANDVAPGLDLRGVYAQDAANAWFVSEGHILHWNGQALEEEANPTSDSLVGIHGSGGKVWAAAYDTILERDAGRWVVRSDAPALDSRNDALLSIFSVAGHLYAAGAGPNSTALLVHFDGTTWTRESPPAGQPLYARLTGSGPDDLWLGALHWDGTAYEWRESLHFASVFEAFAKDDVIACGYPAAIEKWDGAAWHDVRAAPFDWAFQSLTVIGPSDAWAAASDQLVHWDGQAWKAAFTLRGAGQVWAAAADDVWATTAAGLWRFDGSHWRAMTIPPELKGIYAIGGSSASDVWIVAQTGIWHWDGSGFTDTLAAPSGWGSAGIWATAETAWIGWYGVYQWDGTQWITRTPPGTNELYEAVWGSAPNDVWAASIFGALWHWDGMWTSVARPAGMGPFKALWGTAADDVYATDGSAIARFDGQAWTVVANAGPGLSLQVLRANGGQVWAAGQQVMRGSGTTWATLYTEPAPAYEKVLGMFLANDGSGFAVGARGMALHRGAESWDPVRIPDAYRWNSAWGASADDVWLVGSTPFAHWNGTSFASVDPGTGSSTFINGVWGSAANDVWVVGNSGTIAHWDGQAWSARADGYAGSDDLTAISGLGANDVWVAGYDTVLHWDGTAWAREAIDPEAQGSYLRSISVLRSGSDVVGFAVGDDEVVLQRVVDASGARWAKVAFPNTGDGDYPEGLAAVLVASPHEAWIATEGRGSRFVFRWDGSNWAPATFPASKPPTALALSPSGEVFAGGPEGSVFRLVK